MGDIDLGKITHEEARRIFNELKAENQALRNFLDMQKDQVELLTTITENMLDMVVLSDLEGNITFAGKAHETFGHEDGFLIGKNVLDFVHPEHLPYVLEEFNKLLASGGPQTVEYRFRCTDGSYMWLETVGKVINDESNNPRKIVFSAREITGRKQAEEALRQSENYYRTIFETSGTAMFIIEEDTIISHANSYFEELSGYSRQEVEGKKFWTEFIHPDDVVWMKENHYLRRRNPDAAPRQYEFRFITRHGETRNLLLATDMIPGTNRSIASCIDITQQKNSDEELRLSEQRFRSIFEDR